MDGMRDATTLEKRMMARAAALGRPINGSLELTPLCTMDCGMCYVRLNRQDMAEIYRIGQELDVPVHTDCYMVPALHERGLPGERQTRLDPEGAVQGLPCRGPAGDRGL